MDAVSRAFRVTTLNSDSFGFRSVLISGVDPREYAKIHGYTFPR